METDPKILEEKFKSLPEEVQQALSSVAIKNEIRDIGNEFGLALDIQSILFDQVAFIMLGLSSAKDFVKDFSRESGTDEELVKKIAGAVNTRVFSKIKLSMQVGDEKNTETPDTEKTAEHLMAPLERAGGFEIERDSMRESSLEDKNPVTPHDRANLLAAFENPPPVQSRMASRGAAMTNGNGTEPKTEPLVDQLLRGSTAIPEEKITHVPEKTEPKKSAVSDPYREAF